MLASHPPSRKRFKVKRRHAIFAGGNTIVGVNIMIAEIIIPIFIENSDLPRGKKFSGRFQKKCSAAGSHVVATAVIVRAGDAGSAATDANVVVVSCPGAIATRSPVDEKVVVASIRVKVGGFNRVARGGVDGELSDRGIRGVAQPGRRIKLNEINAIPK